MVHTEKFVFVVKIMQFPYWDNVILWLSCNLGGVVFSSFCLSEEKTPTRNVCFIGPIAQLPCYKLLLSFFLNSTNCMIYVALGIWFGARNQGFVRSQKPGGVALAPS